jgi:hypothetical protein
MTYHNIHDITYIYNTYSIQTELELPQGSVVGHRGYRHTYTQLEPQFPGSRLP